MTSRIIDLGFVGDIARCPKCGSRVEGEFSKYIAGSPGLNEYRSDCPGCNTKLRFRGNNWFAGYPDFEWVSPNGKWAIIGVFDGPVLEFDDAVAHVELAWPEGDNAVPIIILLDGSIVWGYDEDYRRSDYPENVARECETRLRRRYAELVNIPSKGTASRSVRSKPKSKSGKGKTNQTGIRRRPSHDPYDRYYELVRSRGYLSVPGGVIKLPDGTELYAESEMTLFEDQSPDEISFWTNCEDADGGSWGVAFTFPLDYFERTPNGKLDWQGHVVDWTYDGPASASVRSKPKSNSGTNNVHGKPGASTQQTPTGFNRDSIVSKSEGLNIADSGKTDETSANWNRSKRHETSKDSSKRTKSGSDSKSSSTRTKTKAKTKPTKGAR